MKLLNKIDPVTGDKYLGEETSLPSSTDGQTYRSNHGVMEATPKFTIDESANKIILHETSPDLTHDAEISIEGKDNGSHIHLTTSLTGEVGSKFELIDSNINLRANILIIDIPSKGNSKVLTSHADGSVTFENPPSGLPAGVKYSLLYYNGSVWTNSSIKTSTDEIVIGRNPAGYFHIDILDNSTMGGVRVITSSTTPNTPFVAIINSAALNSLSPATLFSGSIIAGLDLSLAVRKLIQIEQNGSDIFVVRGTGQILSKFLAGTGDRVLVADSSGNIKVGTITTTDTIENVGTGVGIFKESAGSTHKFKTLDVGTNLEITEDATNETITLNVNTSTLPQNHLVQPPYPVQIIASDDGTIWKTTGLEFDVAANKKYKFKAMLYFGCDSNQTFEIQLLKGQANTTMKGSLNYMSNLSTWIPKLGASNNCVLDLTQIISFYYTGGQSVMAIQIEGIIHTTEADLIEFKFRQNPDTNALTIFKEDSFIEYFSF